MHSAVRLSKTYLGRKQKAIILRKRGRSYKEVADTFKVSKSTAYLWTRKIKLSNSAQKRIQRKIEEALKRGLIAYNKIYGKIRSQEAAKIREGYKKKALKEIKRLSLEDLKLVGIALYWAEGAKKNRNMFRFSNSDPSAIKIMMRFLLEICKTPKEKIRAKMHLYPQIDPKKATFYWSKIARLPQGQFVKPQFQISKTSKGKRNPNTLPYGTLHLEVYNTELTWRMKGWIEGLIKKSSAGVT